MVPQTTVDRARSALWRNGFGPLITLAAAAVLELLRQLPITIPNPGVPLTLTIVLSFILGGWKSGSLSAVLAWMYGAYYFSLPGQPFRFSNENVIRAIITACALPLLVALLNVMKRSSDRTADDAASEARLGAQLAEQSRFEESLREAGAKVGSFARYLRTIIEVEPEGVELIAPDGKLLDVNPSGLAMRECGSLDEARTCMATDFVAPESSNAFRSLHERVMRGENGTLAFDMFGRRGGRRHVETHAVPLRDRSGQIKAVLAITRDVTEQRRAEAGLRERERFIERMAEATPVIMYVFDVIDNRNIYTNRRITDQLGYSPGQIHAMEGGILQHLLHPDDVARLPSILTRWDTAKDDEVLEIVYRLRDARGEWRWFVGRDAVFTRGQDGRVREIIGTAHDITDRKRAEEELRASRLRLIALSRRLLDVQETERRRLARELHDEIGQVLTAVGISLHSVKDTVGPDEVATIDEGLHIVDRAIQQVRDLSLDLRPSMLDDLGLESALRWHLDRQARLAGFDAHFVSELAGRRLAPEIETTCFRVVQEALTNVARYANAKSVRVELRERDDTMQIVIEDDGVGFDVDASTLRASRGGSFGIISMCERVQLVGGRIEIKSSSGRGTRISASFANLSPTPAETDTTEDTVILTSAERGH